MPPHQSSSVGIEPLKLADNSLKCPIYLRYTDSSENELIIRNETLNAKKLVELGTICHYEAVDSNGFHNALSACSIENFVALIRIHEHQYILEYDQDNSRFFLIPQSTKSCEWTKLRSKRSLSTNSIPKKIPSYYFKYLDDITRHIELILIADTSMYKKYDSDEKKVYDRLQAIANIANSLYASLKIRITLVWADIWKTEDKIPIGDIDQILDDFMQYRKTILSPKHPNDNAHLITDKSFNQIVGKAYKGTICLPDNSGGVVVDYHRDPVYVGATLAHEMGHNLGMDHDLGYPKPCKCEGKESCIMAKMNSFNLENFFFSTCSLDYLQKFKHQDCLKNLPKKSFGDAKCGNGILEGAEECDCGSTTNCSNKCCIPNTCRLAPKAKCANGDCCDIDICMPKPAAFVCRSSTNSCDLPEYCDGQNSQCPDDFFVQNGHSCPDSKDDFCYDGICGNRDQQCKFIWGSSGENSVSECYKYNTQRDINGNCGYDSNMKIYTACAPENIECGRLQCQQLNEKKPIFKNSRVVIERTSSNYVHLSTSTSLNKKAPCHVIMTSKKGEKGKHEPAADLGMVRDGAKCGKNNDKICLKAKCRNRWEIQQHIPKCEPENCNNNGICNNVGNCHCKNEYGGFGCDIQGYGGSLNSGPAQTTNTFFFNLTIIIILLILLASIVVIFLFATFYFKWKHKFWLHKKIWYILRDKLHIQHKNVPIRKAPLPPPTPTNNKIQSIQQRFCFNTIWVGDGGDRTNSVVYPKTSTTTTKSPTINGIFSLTGGNKIIPSNKSVTPKKIGHYSSKNLPIYKSKILPKTTPKMYKWPPPNTTTTTTTDNNISNSKSITPLKLSSPPSFLSPHHKNMATIKNQKKEPNKDLIRKNFSNKPITNIKKSKPTIKQHPIGGIKSIVTNNTIKMDNSLNITNLNVKEIAARFNTNS